MNEYVYCVSEEFFQSKEIKGNNKRNVRSIITVMYYLLEIGISSVN